MTSWRERAFDVVLEITKQVLTLATGIVVLSITFSKDFATHPSHSSRVVFGWSWVTYAASILAGLLTLMASAGVQDAAAEQATEPSIRSGNLRVLGGTQLCLFFVGVVLTVTAGVKSI
jgi:hypothetical protein